MAIGWKEMPCLQCPKWPRQFPLDLHLCYCYSMDISRSRVFLSQVITRRKTIIYALSTHSEEDWKGRVL